MHTTNTATAINATAQLALAAAPPDDTTTPGAAPPERLRRYRTILADPPWWKGQQGKLGAAQHYDLMSTARIMQLPVENLAADNAHLYLWCYPGTRYLAEDVMRAWGFRFVDEFVWGKDQMGLGQYFRHAHETLLLGVKGKLPVQFRGQRSFTMLPRQSHSHKPEEVHTMIRRMSPGPYLELFARRPTHGWDIWGNEVESDIRIPGYPVPSDNLPPRDLDPRTEVPHD